MKIKIKIKQLLSGVVVLYTGVTFASTFVGNGGNVGEIELLVSQKQIKQGMERISESKLVDSSCQCALRFENHPLCEHFKKLTAEQINYCSQVLKNKSSKIVELLSPNSPLKHIWTHDKITVQEGLKGHATDAVANFKDQTVTVNQDKFLELTAYERVFLLTHEYFHFIEVDGQRLQDLGQVGVFTETDGHRLLVNALAAATVMSLHKQNLFRKYNRSLGRGQGWKKNWVDFDLNGFSDDSEERTFNVESSTGARLGFRKYINSFGWEAYLGYGSGDVSVLTSITGEEVLRYTGLGLTHRFFPFKDPLSFMGQAHVVSGIRVEYLQSEYQLSDNIQSSTRETTSVGYGAHLRFQIPIFLKAWLYAQGEVMFHDYEHKEYNVKYDGFRTGVSLGVSYGF